MEVNVSAIFEDEDGTRYLHLYDGRGIVGSALTVRQDDQPELYAAIAPFAYNYNA